MIKPRINLQQLKEEYLKFFKEETPIGKIISLSNEDKEIIRGNRSGKTHIKTILTQKKTENFFRSSPYSENKKWKDLTTDEKKDIKDIFSSWAEIPEDSSDQLQKVIEKSYKKEFVKLNFSPEKFKIILEEEVLRELKEIMTGLNICSEDDELLEKLIILSHEEMVLLNSKIGEGEKSEYETLLSNNPTFNIEYNKYEDLMKSTSEKFETKITEFEDVRSKLKEIRKKRDIVKDFFIEEYEKMSKSDFKHEYLFKYFPTCPYCNTTYLFRLKKKTITNKKSKNYVGAQLDHYFPKSDYPYLAISILNLIPACPTCNHIKSDDEREHLYPYEEELGEDAKFNYSLKFFSELKGINNDSLEEKGLKLDEYFGERVELKIAKGLTNGDKRDRIKNSNKIFRLEEKHSSLKEEMKDLYFKHKCTSSSQLEELRINFESLNLTDDEIKEIYYGVKIDKDKYHERPLSKFINDLIDDLETK